MVVALTSETSSWGLLVLRYPEKVVSKLDSVRHGKVHGQFIFESQSDRFALSEAESFLYKAWIMLYQFISIHINGKSSYYAKRFFFPQFALYAVLAATWQFCGKDARGLTTKSFGFYNVTEFDLKLIISQLPDPLYAIFRLQLTKCL
jgi:hypothetical protein